VSIEREYEIILQPEPESGFSVLVPELPSVATQGETIEEATEMAREAIEAYLEVMHKDGFPNPDRPPQQRRCSVGVNPTFPETRSRSCFGASQPSLRWRWWAAMKRGISDDRELLAH
jgi:antitoxin HicB